MLRRSCPDQCYDTFVLYSIFEYLLCCVLLIPYYWSRKSNSYIISLCISPVVPTGTPVYDKFCLCISPVVPTGTPVSV